VATEPINIPIQTTYDDDGAKEALQDAEQLEKLDPTVQVEADTSQAVSDIDDVTTVAKDLVDRNPWIAEVLSDTGAAKSDIESFQTKLRETGDVADDTKRHVDKIGDTGGPRLAGNQVADLTGPLGDASGAASNLGGVFDGLADITEKVAGKVGLDAAKMAGAVSGIGFAVAAAAAVWTLFRQKQAEAKKKAEEHLKLQEEITKAIEEGNREVAASKFIDLYGDIIDKGLEAGLSINEVVDAIRGTGDAAKTADSKIAEFDTRIADLNRSYQELHATTAASGAVPSGEEKALADQLVSLRNSRDALIDAKGEWSNMTAEQQANIDKQGAVQTALLGTEEKTDKVAAAADRAKKKTEDLTAAFDILKGSLDLERTMEDFEADINTAMANVALGVPPTKEEIRTIEDTIIEVGEMAGKTPIEVRSELDKIDHGDLFSVLNDAQSWANEHKVKVQFEVAQDAKQKIRDVFAGFGINVPITGSASKSASGASQTVNVNLPRGARHGDIARAMGLSTRRNGRRYGNPSGTVSYARHR
jgi:hypothetical protein